jgi:hypothetical protein
MLWLLPHCLTAPGIINFVCAGSNPYIGEDKVSCTLEGKDYAHVVHIKGVNGANLQKAVHDSTQWATKVSRAPRLYLCRGRRGSQPAVSQCSLKQSSGGQWSAAYRDQVVSC